MVSDSFLGQVKPRVIFYLTPTVSTNVNFPFFSLPCCPEITDPLLVDDIFFKIDERTIIFLWKGVKCFCGGVRKPSRTVPDGSGHLRPIFKFFSISKKALFLWYTFRLKIAIFESCEFYSNFGPVFYLQWEIALRQF